MTKGKFPNGLREAMDAKNIGATELARMIETSKQNVDRWAKAERALKPEVAAKIAPLLGVTAGDLLLLPQVNNHIEQSQDKQKKMEADAKANLRSALLAYGVDKRSLGNVIPLIDTFVKKAVAAQSEQSSSRDLSLPSTPRRVE
jgi:plasmid maintenance system antidote protein VapI